MEKNRHFGENGDELYLKIRNGKVIGCNGAECVECMWEHCTAHMVKVF